MNTQTQLTLLQKKISLVVHFTMRRDAHFSTSSVTNDDPHGYNKKAVLIEIYLHSYNCALFMLPTL